MAYRCTAFVFFRKSRTSRRRPIRLGQCAILVMALGAPYPKPAHAAADGATPPPASQRMRPITVEGRQERAAPAWARRHGRRELDRLQIRDWTDLGKRAEAGLGYNRRNHSVNLRGLDQDRLLTRVDGIRVPWLNDGARGVRGGLGTVDFRSLSRLDITRGADGGTAGSGAMGAVIDLHTFDPEDLLASGQDFGALLKTQTDSADHSRGVEAAFAGRAGPTTNWLLQAGGQRGHALRNRASEGGYGAGRGKNNPQNSRQENFLFKLSQHLGGAHRLGFTGERFDRRDIADDKFDQGPGTKYAYGANQSRHTARRERLSLDYRYAAATPGGLADSAQAVMYWQRLQLADAMQGMRTPDARSHIRRGDPFQYGYPSGAFSRDNTMQDASWGLSAQASRSFGGAIAQRLTLGAEWQASRLQQYAGGHDNCSLVNESLPHPFGPRSCSWLHTGQADNPAVQGRQTALWASDEFSFLSGRYTLVPSLRYDHSEASPQNSAAYARNANAAGLPPRVASQRLSPKLLSSWHPRKGVSLFAQYGYGYKAPSAAQLYSNYGGPATYLSVGNPRLKAETSKGWEIGTRLGDDALGGTLSLFDNRYRNFIETGVPLDASSPQWQPAWAGHYPYGIGGAMNRQRVRIFGGEASLRWRFARHWHTWGSLAWAQGKDRSTGRYLNSVAPLKTLLGLGYESQQWGASSLLTAAARRSKTHYGPHGSKQEPHSDFVAPGYTLVDLLAYWHPQAIKGMRLEAGVFNLFDRKYWEAINLPSAGASGPPRPWAAYTEAGRSMRVSLTYQY